LLNFTDAAKGIPQDAFLLFQLRRIIQVLKIATAAEAVQGTPRFHPVGRTFHKVNQLAPGIPAFLFDDFSGNHVPRGYGFYKNRSSPKAG
jgi:hypothetical protein